ncbi:hypothetical protein FB567DRAFT_453048 [Paraphoma chrysanthemicola]|uniref:Uncharacterized protein n=1 Tax=Paraphoma chrysanthemicola TaxID=798071 RepID=A0A8K0QYA6_9PLEO|nr:hypothetical protein FB567DRAFT_453048 [Paraphoma chrysanthemicola]
MRLANIVAQHEDTIRKRWIKKTQAQKKEILLKALPGMAPMHRPDIDDVLHQCCPYNRHPNGIAYHAYPYINQEDLLKPKSLLMLLNARGRHLPHKFAYLDCELGPLGQIRPMLLEKTTFTLDFIDTYGGIVEHESEQDAQQSIDKGLTMHPAHGWQILMVHWVILDFLTRCCMDILHDMPLESVLRTDPSPLPSEPPALSDNNELYSSLEVATREASYQVPARLDLGRLRGLVSACRSSAEDHIWSLREDPGYFAEVVTENREHRQELLRGQDGRIAHTTRNERPLMNKVLRSVITDAYAELYTWEEVERRITQLHQMSLDYADQIHDTHKNLPEPFFEALVETWFFLEVTMLDFIHQIKHGWCASPTMRPYWVLDDSKGCKCCGEPKFLGIDHQDRDLRKLSRLINFLSHSRHRVVLGVHPVVDAIERLLQSNTRAKSFTSPWIASYLSQLSVATECFHQLQLYQPWARQIKRCVEQRKTKLFICYAQVFAKWNSIFTTKFVGADLYELGKPSKFYYPVHKRRTRAHVETMRSAEAALDAFWQAADDRFRQHTGKTPHDVVAGIISERTLQRTSPWVESDNTSAKLAQARAPEYIYIPFANHIHDPTKQITGVFDRLTIINNMEKFRTPKTVHMIDKREKHDPPFRSEVHMQSFQVDKRALKVFRTLFHSPLSYDQPGEIPWTEFLHAMVKTGFSAQKLSGSAWQFIPRGLDISQPIQFHEPHPSSKLPFTWARRFGRRLSRTYGWKGDMFRLA